MRILITGGAGFIGSHLWDALEAEGHDVSGIDTFATGRNYVARDGMWEGNVCGPLFGPHTRDVLDLIIHCAASYDDPANVSRDVDTNVHGMLNVLRLARANDAKVVYFQTALPPLSSYAISKTAALQYLLLARDVESLTFRLANVYGPRNLSGPVPAFYKRLTAGEDCTVTDTLRDLVYIDDLVQIVTSRLEEETGVVDVHTGHHTRIAAVYLAVCEAIGVSRAWTQTPCPPDDVKAMQFAGHAFKPTVTLRDGVNAACQWYAEHGVTDTYTHLALA